MVNAHVAVHVEEAEGGSARLHTVLGQRAAELARLAASRQPSELAAQRLDLGSTV